MESQKTCRVPSELVLHLTPDLRRKLGSITSELREIEVLKPGAKSVVRDAGDALRWLIERGAVATETVVAGDAAEAAKPSGAGQK